MAKNVVEFLKELGSEIKNLRTRLSSQPTEIAKVVWATLEEQKVTTLPERVDALEARPVGNTKTKVVVPEDFGEGVGEGDFAKDTAAWLAMIENAKKNNLMISAAGSYHINQSLDLRRIALDAYTASFVLDNGAVITIGGDAFHHDNPMQKIGKVIRRRYLRPGVVDNKLPLDPTTYTEASIKCIGAKNQDISIYYTDYLLFWMTSDPATWPKEASQSYNRFNINFAIRIDIDTDPRYATGEAKDAPGSRNQWFNQNIVNITRGQGLNIKGSYNHNCNTFSGGVFENDTSYLNIEVGMNNTFQEMRLEKCGRIYFGPNTESNVLMRTWYSSSSAMNIDNVEDLGKFNKIESRSLSEFVRSRVFQMLPRRRNYGPNTTSNQITLQKVSQTIQAQNRYSLLGSSDLIPMKPGRDILVFDMDKYHENEYLIRLQIFDESGVLIDPVHIKTESVFIKNRVQARKTLEGTMSGRKPYYQNHFAITSDTNTLNGTKYEMFYVKFYLLTSADVTKAKATWFTVDLLSADSVQGKTIDTVESEAAPTQYIGFVGDVVRYRGGYGIVKKHQQTKIVDISEGVRQRDVSNGDYTLFEFAIDISTFTNVRFSAGDLVGFEDTYGDVWWTTLYKAQVNLDTNKALITIIYTENTDSQFLKLTSDNDIFVYMTNMEYHTYTEKVTNTAKSDPV